MIGRFYYRLTFDVFISSSDKGSARALQSNLQINRRSQKLIIFLNARVTLEKPISRLLSLTCHTKSHSVTCHPTLGEGAMPYPEPNRPVFDLPTSKG